MQVDLACKILDGGPFRDDPDKVITVQPAKFEMHGDTYIPKKKKQKKKKKVVKEDKVLGWGGFDDMLPPTQVSGLNFQPGQMRITFPWKPVRTWQPSRCCSSDKLKSLGFHQPTVQRPHFRGMVRPNMAGTYRKLNHITESGEGSWT